jgi:hypothetical protein
MIYLTRPPYCTWNKEGTIQHFNLHIDKNEVEYFGICQQIEAQIMGLA